MKRFISLALLFAHVAASGGSLEKGDFRVTYDERGVTGLANVSVPHGPWHYDGEIDLGFGGALRMAATVLTRDPIFDWFAYGGTLKVAKETHCRSRGAMDCASASMPSSLNRTTRNHRAGLKLNWIAMALRPDKTSLWIAR